MTEIKIVYGVYSNSDLNEGRGMEIRVGTYQNLATAVRLAKNRGPQGSNAEIREVKVYHFKNDLYLLPKDLFEVIKPSLEDSKVPDKEVKQLAYHFARKRASDLGLSDYDLKIISQGAPE